MCVSGEVECQLYQRLNAFTSMGELGCDGKFDMSAMHFKVLVFICACRYFVNKLWKLKRTISLIHYGAYYFR